MHEVATTRHLRFIQLAQEFQVILVVLSALRVLILVGANDDIGLAASNDVSHFIPCRFVTVSVRCLLRGDSDCVL